jgi:hypothetical protein
MGVPAERKIRELCCLNVKSDQKNSISESYIEWFNGLIIIEIRFLFDEKVSF